MPADAQNRLLAADAEIAERDLLEEVAGADQFGDHFAEGLPQPLRGEGLRFGAIVNMIVCRPLGKWRQPARRMPSSPEYSNASAGVRLTGLLHRSWG